jgi:group I intron endonuclease
MTGVYAIICIPTGKQYIGSSAKSFKSRYQSHWRLLNLGCHHSVHLQRAWNKYGEEAFEFRPLIVCAPDMVVFYEQRAIDAMRPEFNRSPTAGNTLGLKQSDEHKNKCSARMKDGWANGDFANRDLSSLKTPEYSALRSEIIKRSWANGSFANKKARPINAGAKHELRGEKLTIRQISEKYGFKPGTIQFRLANGLQGEDLIAPLMSTHPEKIRAWRKANPERVREAAAKSAKKRSSKFEIRGEQLDKYEIAEKYGFKIWTINRRIEHGKLGEDLIAPLHDVQRQPRNGWGEDHTRRKNAKRYLVAGEELSIHEISEKYDISKDLVRDRTKRGVRGEKLIEPKRGPP